MDTGTSSWWRRHGWTVGLLLLAFGIAFTIRTVWTWPVLARWGALYTYAGGSDSYYHSRVMTYIIETHTNLVYDPMLKFPVGAINPREPLFDWMNAILGLLFAPFFGGGVNGANNAGAFFLALQAPLWASLQVFPIYLIGREVSGRRNGLIAAMVYPFLSASINTSTLGYGDYQSFYTFFLLVVIYSYLRMLKAVGHRRYVGSYRGFRELGPALREFFRTERTAVKWAVFTGVSMGAFALSWQGYTDAIVVVVFATIVALLIERMRKIDSFGLYVSTWLIGLVAFPMAAPYYIVQHEIKIFLELPIILFFGALLLLLPFLLMRDTPWVFSVPALLAVVGGGVLALRFLAPPLYTAAITGDGYFVKNLIYSTVAEAQPPSIDALVVGYGIITFFLAFAGLALFAYQLVRQRFKRYLIAFLLFAVVSIYLPISATKFFLVAAPAYALLAAEAVHRLLDVGGYPQLRRAVASLTDRTGSATAFRKSFKARHVLVLALAVGILLPNLWIGIDAGIPSNTKDQFAEQINDTIPSWLKLNQSAPSSNYLGAAGSGLDTPNQYDSAGYSWLAQQDTNLPEPDRPAVVAWWDYGFQTIDQGQHPSVADNFQNGIDPAGQFLLAQNESLAIGVLAAALLQAEILASHDPTLPTALNQILARDGVNVTALHGYLDNEANDYNLVVHDPAKYLPVNPSTLTDDNAMYLATSYFFADHLTLNGVSRVYDALEAYTGWSIRYAMTDSRTFPFTGSDTGIFYAPADLTGRVVNSEGVPTTFYNVTILGTDGNTYPLGPLPAGVGAEEYNINWSSAFYNTMLYRIYIGYNGTDAGQSGGIPGLNGAAAGDPIEPGWMLQHFEVEYETAYACAGPNASAAGDCRAMNRPAAVALANATNGTDNLTAVEYFEGGESILAYYPGVTLYGTLVLPNGAPVPDARVTVYDGWGIPHMTNVTNAQGQFSLVLPPGNDTLNFSYGAFEAQNQTDADLIASVPLTVPDSLGFATNAPSMVQSFTVQNATLNGQVYWNISGNSSYSPSKDTVVRGAKVVLTDLSGVATASVVTDASGTFHLAGLAPGTYNVSVVAEGHTFSAHTTNLSSGSVDNLSIPLSPGTIAGRVLTTSGAAYSDATVTLANASGTYETTLSTSSGNYTFPGVGPGSYTVYAVGSSSGLTTNRVGVVISTAGENVSANLTIESRGSVQVLVRAGGTALVNASVTLTPLLSFADSSSSAVGAVLAGSTNSTLGLTNGLGVATLGVPMGNYTLTATGHYLGAIYTASEPVNVSSTSSVPALTVALEPAEPVTVTVPGNTSIPGVVVATGPNGTEHVGWVGENRSTVLELAAGSYTFLVLYGSNASGSSAQVALFARNVTGPLAFTPALGPSEVARFTVGSPISGGTIYPAAGARVVVSAGSAGPTLVGVASANGTVGFAMPTSSPTLPGGYCVSASAFGFTSTTSCDHSPASLDALGNLATPVKPVAVTLHVDGLPSGTNVTALVTGESSGATSLTISGPPTFSFTLAPGTYGIGAKAVLQHGAKIYLPSAVLSTTIPLGATYSNLTLIVVPEINVSGKLGLPAGATAGNVTVSLVSPLLNVTVNGTNYTKTDFRATPANYTATASVVLHGVRYMNITKVTVSANGTVWPKIVLTSAGTFANLTLAKPSGATLDVNTTAKLVSSTGLVLLEPVTNGSYTNDLPPGTYRVYVNLTAATAGPNGTFLTNWTSGLSASCTFSTASTSCKVAMAGTADRVVIHGTLVASGSTVPVPGSLRLIGPYPSTNVTVLSAANGTYTATVEPGAYYGYASSSSGALLAGFGRLLALPNGPSSVTIALEPSWTATVRLSVANPLNTTVGAATVTVRDAFGDLATFAPVSVGVPISFALPLGAYTLSANASGVLNGVAGTATASAPVNVTVGNVLVPLALAVPVRPTVTAALASGLSFTIPAGRSAAIAFTVNDSGNVPVTVTPVGSPANWGFNFSFQRLTLVPGESVSASVLVTVPAGALVSHAPVTLSFDLPNGTAAGSVSPTVVVPSFYGLGAGPIAKSPPQVGSSSAVLSLYLNDSGNTFEAVRLSIVNAAVLASYGWKTVYEVHNATINSPELNLSAGENLTVEINLTSTTSAPVPPTGITVEATVLNGTGTLSRSFVLTIPHPEVRTTSGTFGVTGPLVQSGPSALPSWFVPVIVFVPALALIAGVLTYRWWRTRKWTRR